MINNDNIEQEELEEDIEVVNMVMEHGIDLYFGYMEALISIGNTYLYEVNELSKDMTNYLSNTDSLAEYIKTDLYKEINHNFENVLNDGGSLIKNKLKKVIETLEEFNELVEDNVESDKERIYDIVGKNFFRDRIVVVKYKDTEVSDIAKEFIKDRINEKVTDEQTLKADNGRFKKNYIDEMNLAIFNKNNSIENVLQESSPLEVDYVEIDRAFDRDILDSVIDEIASKVHLIHSTEFGRFQSMAKYSLIIDCDSPYLVAHLSHLLVGHSGQNTTIYINYNNDFIHLT